MKGAFSILPANTLGRWAVRFSILAVGLVAVGAALAALGQSQHALMLGPLALICVCSVPSLHIGAQP
jgi:hypothetical protein